MAKTKAEVRRLATSSAMKKYKNFSAIQLGRELNKLQKQFKIDPAEGTKIKIAVVKKLISKVPDKEISATEARKELKKKVPAKAKKVSKQEFEKARKDLKKKKVDVSGETEAPKAKKGETAKEGVTKDLFQEVMNVMTEVAKDRKKSRPSEIDERTKLNKEAQAGKIKFNDLFTYALNDNDFGDLLSERENNVVDDLTWGSDFYRLVKRVTKRDVDTFEDLTDRQQERFIEIIQNEGQKLHTKYIKDEVFNPFIKGKKFKTADEARKLFIKKYEEN